MAFDGSALRQASDNPLPFKQHEVPPIRLGADGYVEQAYTVADKQDLLRVLGPEDGLLAAWTGQYRTDSSGWTTWVQS